MLTMLLAAAMANAAPGDAWPAFRGDGDSVSAAKNLPVTWSEADGVAWSAALPGPGQSSPVVHGGRVFVTCVVGGRKEQSVVLAVDLKSGEIVWTKEFASSVPGEISDYVSQAAPTPAADAERVYALFETGNFVALDRDGRTVWERSLATDYGKFEGNHGLGSSLAVTDDAVVALVDHDGPSYLLAVDKRTGKNLWKADRPQKVSWSSPIVDRTGDAPRIVVSSSGTCEALDAKTGERVWIVEGLDGNTVPSATVAADLLLIGSSAPSSNVAVRRGGTGDVTKSHVAWRSDEASATFSSPLGYRGRVYMVNRAGVAFCLDLATGKPVWTRRLGGSCWASPLGAEDRVHFFGKTGTTTVVAATGTETQAEALAENVLPAEGPVYGVAAVDGRFVIRTARRLFCVASKPPAAK